MWKNAASGFDVDLEVKVETPTLYRVYLGRAELGSAIRAGQLTMSAHRVRIADDRDPGTAT